MIEDLDTLPPLGSSDHLSLTFTVAMHKPHAANRTSKPLYHLGQYKDMASELDETDWEETLASLGTEDAWQCFHHILAEKMDKFIPQSKSKQRKNKKRWITKDALRLQAQKRRAWKQAKHTKHLADKQRAKRLAKKPTENDQRSTQIL